MCHYNNLCVSLCSQWHGELIAAALRNGKVFCSQQHDTDARWKSWLQSLFYCFSQQQWGQVVLNLAAHVALCNLLNRRNTFILVNGYWQPASVKHYHSGYWPHGDCTWALPRLMRDSGRDTSRMGWTQTHTLVLQIQEPVVNYYLYIISGILHRVQNVCFTLTFTLTLTFEMKNLALDFQKSAYLNLL